MLNKTLSRAIEESLREEVPQQKYNNWVNAQKDPETAKKVWNRAVERVSDQQKKSRDEFTTSDWGLAMRFAVGEYNKTASHPAQTTGPKPGPWKPGKTFDRRKGQSKSRQSSSSGLPDRRSTESTIKNLGEAILEKGRGVKEESSVADAIPSEDIDDIASGDDLTFNLDDLKVRHPDIEDGTWAEAISEVTKIQDKKEDEFDSYCWTGVETVAVLAHNKARDQEKRVEVDPEYSLEEIPLVADDVSVHQHTEVIPDSMETGEGTSDPNQRFADKESKKPKGDEPYNFFKEDSAVGRGLGASLFKQLTGND